MITYQPMKPAVQTAVDGVAAYLNGVHFLKLV
jgi:hypothetical protein